MNDMKEIFVAFLKWFILLVCVDLASGLLHEDLIQATGAAFALFMFVKLLPRYIERPFWGLVFSLLVISISGISATGLLKYVFCEWYPGITNCLPNFLSAQYFGFFVFPALIVVPWGALVIRKFFRRNSLFGM